MAILNSFNILIPKEEFIGNWPVIACDQFTSQPDYWKQQRESIKNAPSSLNCILPEAELAIASDTTYRDIRDAMQKYSHESIFKEYVDSFVYVERTLIDGSIRAGVVGVIDLEAYDYHSDSISAIRATERTVVERIPPRIKVRRGAPLELSHVLLLCDDDQHSIIDPLKEEVTTLLYDLDLPQGGGHITGWLVDGEKAGKLQKRISNYCQRKGKELNGMLFAVGDGNHSLAAAKECYEELKRTTKDADAIRRARFTMVELENIHDSSQKFEPIHRLISETNVDNLMTYLIENCCSDDGYPLTWVSGKKEGTIYLDKNKGVLPVGILQNALDDYLASRNGMIDYIHGELSLRELSELNGSIGFVLPAIPKDDFFRGIVKDGVLPRKAFSMGEAQEKRYYLETRRLF